MLAFPAWLRLLGTVAVAVAVAVAVVRVMHPRILRLNASPPESSGDGCDDSPPAVDKLGGRLIALSTFAFVFLLAFVFGQFWTTAVHARQATAAEASDFVRAVTLTQTLPPRAAAPLSAALSDYRDGVDEVEWPLMQQADTEQLARVRFAAAAELGDAALAADEAGGRGTVQWDALESSLNDLVDDGHDRTTDLPSFTATASIWLVALLGAANLGFTAVFQPAALRPNLVIIGLMAALTAFLVFVLIEISNPFVGAGAVGNQLQWAVGG